MEMDRLKWKTPAGTFVKLCFIVFVYGCSLMNCYNLEGGNSKITRNVDNLASPSNLTNWAAKETAIYHYFKYQYTQGRYETWPSVSKLVLLRYFTDFVESSGVTTDIHKEEFSPEILYNQAVEISSNPIMVYRMLHRIINYNEILQELGDKSSKSLSVDELDIWDEIINLEIATPTILDLEEAMESVLRLHHIYDFNLTEFASGFIADLQTNTRLDAVHCHEIGVYASRVNYHDLSIQWLELAYFKVHSKGDTSIQAETVDRALLLSILRHDLAFKSLATWVPAVYSNNIWGQYNTSKESRRRRKAVQYETWKGRKESNFNDVNFWGLCTGVTFQTEQERSQLHCWLDLGKNGVNVVGPSKMELLSTNPYIVQVYDVIGPKLMERIIGNASKDLGRSEVLNDDQGKEGESKLSKVRTSANTWLYTKKKLDLIKLEARIESITGLIVSEEHSSEALQVASYVFGRHYDVHTDTLKFSTYLNDEGDRIATFMIYLNKPIAGGYTAFSQAGIAAKPVTGSAVFWYNLYRNGSTKDTFTWHGACPILLGHKYVANKWIRERAQFRALPCSLNRNE